MSDEKRGRMMRRLVSPLRMQHGGVTRHCYCEDCLRRDGSRSREKRAWRKAVRDD